MWGIGSGLNDPGTPRERFKTTLYPVQNCRLCPPPLPWDQHGKFRKQLEISRHNTTHNNLGIKEIAGELIKLGWISLTRGHGVVVVVCRNFVNPVSGSTAASTPPPLAKFLSCMDGHHSRRNRQKRRQRSSLLFGGHTIHLTARMI